MAPNCSLPTLFRHLGKQLKAGKLASFQMSREDLISLVKKSHIFRRFWDAGYCNNVSKSMSDSNYDPAASIAQKSGPKVVDLSFSYNNATQPELNIVTWQIQIIDSFIVYHSMRENWF